MRGCTGLSERNHRCPSCSSNILKWVLGFVQYQQHNQPDSMHAPMYQGQQGFHGLLQLGSGPILRPTPRWPSIRPLNSSPAPLYCHPPSPSSGSVPPVMQVSSFIADLSRHGDLLRAVQGSWIRRFLKFTQQMLVGAHIWSGAFMLS